MKDLALIFGFAVALLSGTNVSAMPSAEQPADSRNRIPIDLYIVRLEPPVKVLVVPSKEIVKIGKFADSEINIDCKNFEGHPVYSLIYIRHDMSLNDIVDSLCESFDVEGIEYHEDYITEETFSKIFPSFKRKL
ncbi:MAG: hypothetical protein J6T29_00045 [Alphaproteobacteria bacterium]|nr:hypothetical protein [Alphaproteobacteria bacterium]